MNGWESLPVETGSSLGAFLSNSNSCLHIDPASHEPEVFFNSSSDERMWTTIAGQTNFYAQSKIRTAQQGIDVTDAMTHFSHRQQVHHSIW